MSNIATIQPPQKKSITMAMADRYGMDASNFERTLRATVFPANGAPEQFAAFLLVANEYGLNPVTKEIYAFPARGGGIVPVVSIDGWMNLINSNPAFDGMEIDEINNADGGLVATKCTIYRKDRAHPIAVTEYLDECVRSTEPWKMKRRMLRHKAVIQCARYAFGFAGIYDEDEAEKIATAKAIPTPPAPPAPPPAIEAPEPAEAEKFVAAVQREFPGAEVVDVRPSAFDALRSSFQKALANADENTLTDTWERIVFPVESTLTQDQHDDLMSLYRLREGELEP